MNKQTITAIVVVIVVFIGGILMARNGSTRVVENTAAVTGDNTVNTTPIAPDVSNLIYLADPSADAMVFSPLEVFGEARGTWYFEGSFPVHLYDANGVLIGKGVAEAAGDWMTEEFVPFSVTMDFAAPQTETGTLVLFKDNPSGDPANDLKLVTPVKFDLASVE